MDVRSDDLDPKMDNPLDSSKDAEIACDVAKFLFPLVAADADIDFSEASLLTRSGAAVRRGGSSSSSELP